MHCRNVSDSQSLKKEVDNAVAQAKQSSIPPPDALWRNIYKVHPPGSDIPLSKHHRKHTFSKLIVFNIVVRSVALSAMRSCPQVGRWPQAIRDQNLWTACGGTAAQHSRHK